MSEIKNAIVISDTHIGCKLGLCPPKVQLDEGGYYIPSLLQQKLWTFWQEFWNEWVPKVTKGADYLVVHNGDALDGVHHNAVTQISNNYETQLAIAREVLQPIVDNKKCKKYFHIRGTEAHVGPSAQYEEKLAQELGAVPDQNNNHARWEMWLKMAGALIHFTHHVGTTSSASYESTAVYKELIEAYNEAGRYGDKPPDCVIRSHRHRQMEIRISTVSGYGISCVTPGWQLRTPFTYRMGLGRSSMPQIGGYLIRCNEEEHVYTRFKVWKIDRSAEVIV